MAGGGTQVVKNSSNEESYGSGTRSGVPNVSMAPFGGLVLVVVDTLQLLLERSVLSCSSSSSSEVSSSLISSATSAHRFRWTSRPNGIEALRWRANKVLLVDGDVGEAPLDRGGGKLANDVVTGDDGVEGETQDEEAEEAEEAEEDEEEGLLNCSGSANRFCRRF